MERVGTIYRKLLTHNCQTASLGNLNKTLELVIKQALINTVPKEPQLQVTGKCNFGQWATATLCTMVGLRWPKMSVFNGGRTL